MNFILYNIYVRSKEDFLIEKVIQMTEKNLTQASIELIKKIEKQNDEYFSHQMASYSKIFKELEDLKELIQKVGKHDMTEEKRQEVFSIVNSVLLSFYGNKARDLAIEVGYAVINTLEKDEVYTGTLENEILKTFIEQGHYYGFNGSYIEALYLSNKIANKIIGDLYDR